MSLTVKQNGIEVEVPVAVEVEGPAAVEQYVAERAGPLPVSASAPAEEA